MQALAVKSLKSPGLRERAATPTAGTAFALVRREMSMSQKLNDSGFATPTELLLRRARRAQRRGERRQALVALREATLLAETDARLWAIFGAACAKANRWDDAERAFTQALYLRQRQRDALRANALRGLIQRLGLGRAA